MKKYLNYAIFYTVLALAGGVFFREFTRFNAMEGYTTLNVLHTHAFMLGTFVFLFVFLLATQFDFSKSSLEKRWLIIYNAGVLLTIIMLWVRGVLQITTSELSPALNASISGLSGLGHILLTIGFILFLIILKRCVKTKEKTP